MSNHESVTRRQFLLEVAGGTAIISTVIADPLGHGRGDQGKPALTVRSINDYIAAAQREDESTQFLLAAEVKRNVLAFLDQRFTLSGPQRHALEALSDEDRRRISAAVEIALRRRRRLLFRSASAGAATFTVIDDSSAAPASPNGDVILSWPCPAGRAKS